MEDYHKSIDPRTRLDNFIKGKIRSDLPILYNIINQTENECIVEVKWNNK